MTDYPIWDNDLLIDEAKQRSDGKKIASVFVPFAMSAIITKHIIYGDVLLCLSAKSIFVTWDDDKYVLHPVNSDEDEMVLRLSHDRCQKMYERDIFALTDGPPCE